MSNSPVTAARWHRPLVGLAAVMGVLTIVALVGLAVDDRSIGGSPAWLKPCKFAVSLGLYALTLAWLLRFVNRWRRTGWWAATVVALASAGEMVAIVLQAVRGRASHFDVATPFDAMIWNLMGATVMVLWTASLVVAVVVAVQRDTDPVVRSAARLGFALSLAGMALGFLMTQPTGAQQVELDNGGAPAMVGAHSVGVADGGPAMPVTGWSTTGGDLRIPHFAGIHALQALPLLALVLALLAARYPARFGAVRTRLRVVRVAAVGYAGLIALLTWQALRGQPLLEPDALTLLAAGGLAVVVLAGLALAARGRTEPVAEPRVLQNA
ncbi:hypothetical protein ABT369_02045 [Dactylosporangium sp. NPDC000244]|uniref:hypothetical protein n=1 Tax=Dactylosporangium sp. NPDC000244 TaxID=3154365 RepID=UPI003321019E